MASIWDRRAACHPQDRTAAASVDRKTGFFRRVAMFGDGLWSFVVIAGPIILVIALLWAMLRNRTTRAQDARTEQATRDLYREQSAEDRPRTP
jgi:hypothetical protein